MDAAVDFLLENLQQLLRYHVQLLNDAKNQVERLEIDLRSFKTFLDRLSKIEIKNDSLRDLACQIRDVVHEAEDVIDAYVAHASNTRSRNRCLRFFHKPIFISIAKDVERVNGKVNDIHGGKSRIDFATLTVADKDGPQQYVVRIYSQTNSLSLNFSILPWMYDVFR